MKNNSFSKIRMATIVACLFIHHLLNAQWPQWCGQLRDGASAESNLLKEWPAYGPKLIWTSDTIGNGFSSAIIQDKIIYTTGNIDSVEVMTAIDLDGKLIWQRKIGKALRDCESFSTLQYLKENSMPLLCLAKYHALIPEPVNWIGK